MVANVPYVLPTSMNMSNPEPGGPGNGESGACAFNGNSYTETPGFSETIGTTQEFEMSWIAVHPFHHHVQPCVPSSICGCSAWGLCEGGQVNE